jgi:stearoyl-CoA desaturase (delta-9 desaturase)
MVSDSSTRRRYRRSATPFVAFHLVPLLAFVTGVTVRAAVLAVVLYLVRMFAITAGYHRYFSHRTYRMNRALQFAVGFVGTMAVQRGPLWWAGHHRAHHRYADTDRDPHSPMKGFWWSHIGWVLSGDYSRTDYSQIEDLAVYPELRFIDRHDWIGPWALGIASFLIAGWSGLVFGFFLSTVFVWHITFAVNSVAHLFGRRRYGTPDTSRNSLLLALVTLGEGWHNNHHHYPRSVRQGFFWWEIDAGYAVLKVFGWLRIISDLQYPTPAVLGARRIAGGHFDLGRFRQHLAGAARTLPADASDIADLLRAASDRAASRASASRRSKALT